MLFMSLQWPDHIASHLTMTAQPARHVLGLLGIIACACLMTACGTARNASASLAGIVTPYKVPVVQGNFVSKEQMAYVKPGMTRQLARDVLGTPLLASVFHEERWDYVFTLKRQGVEPQARRLTLYFKGDVLDRFEADEMPSEAEFVASIDTKRKGAKVPELEATEDQLKKFEPPAADRAAADKSMPDAAAATSPTVYPPLESPRR
jgi:outer membrane protein assembly factor BamE